MKIIHIVGIRPNFVKLISLYTELKQHQIKQLILHTGQHYNKEMSDIFFKELNLPDPDYNLKIKAKTHAKQIGKMLEKIEDVLKKEKPNLVCIYGDANSTLAGALAASKLNIKMAHIEAGLRSFDKTMPEETNRIIIDHISDYLFTTCNDANKNLIKEGINKTKIFFVGNLMIETLIKNKEKIKNSNILKKLNLKKKTYGIVTLHRASNTKNKKSLNKLLNIISNLPIHFIFPVHPRTKQKIKNLRINNLNLIKPLGYFDFLNLVANSQVILTDSGGIQEETTALNIPCITLRKNTERPITINKGTNFLSLNKHKIIQVYLKITNKKWKNSTSIPLWDQDVAKRISKIILS